MWNLIRRRRHDVVTGALPPVETFYFLTSDGDTYVSPAGERWVWT